MDNQGQTTNGSNIVPSTPAFPVSPPTPYGEWSREDGVKTLECICIWDILWASAFSSQWITTQSFLSSGHGDSGSNKTGHKVNLYVCDRCYACASKLSRTRLLPNRGQFKCPPGVIHPQDMQKMYTHKSQAVLSCYCCFLGTLFGSVQLAAGIQI